MRCRARRVAIRVTLTVGSIVGLAVLFSGFGPGGAVDKGCPVAPPAPSVELVYRLEAGTARVTAATQEESVGIVCSRLQEIGVADALVEPRGASRIRVVLPQLAAPLLRRAVELTGAAGRTYFYDWEPNLIGRERVLGGHPGFEPPARALRGATREWRDAGRSVRTWANEALIFAGALPTAYSAVRLASEQRPLRNCGSCASAGPRFYLFDRGPAHGLLAGPVDSRADLRAGATGHRGGIVLRVPIGTTIVSEPALDMSGGFDPNAAPGWYALRDRPALSGADLVDVAAVRNPVGGPAVAFGFNERGRNAFERMTRKIARRGMANAVGLPPIEAVAAEALSGHLAIVLDGKIRARPIVNFAENPDGIDGRTGAEISGGIKTIGQAQDLATKLSLGALPVNLTLARQRGFR
jgi:SecD/SecF fusion protein